MHNKKLIPFRIVSVILVLLMISSILGVGAYAEPTGSTAETPTSSHSQVTTVTPSPSTPAVTEPVTTPPTIISAYYVSDPSYKSEYFSGEEFDPSGIEIVIAYNNGTIERQSLKEFGNYSPSTLSTSDTKITVKISSDWSLEIPVTVSAKTVTKIDLEGFTDSYKQEYLQGEAFDPSGLKIKATYNDGTSEILDPAKLTVSPAGPLNTTDSRVTISYGGKSLQMTVKIVSIKSIEVKSDASPLVVGQYQIFDKSKITVTATYINEKTRVVDDYTVIDGGFEAVGNGTISIEYCGVSASVKVNVTELEGILVTKKPTKTSYKEGDSLDPMGIEVSGLYSGGVRSPITGYTIDAITLEANADDECVITVKFKDFFTDTFTVSVTPITQLIIKGQPLKTTYYEGEAIDVTGLVVEAVFKNGEKISNFKNYSLNADSLYADSSKKPVISYKNAKAELTITVIAIKAIGVTRNPDRIIFTEGEIFDPTGIEITAFYTDDTYNVIEAGACTYTSTPLQIHDNSVTVTYKNFSTQLDIIVTTKVIVQDLIATVLPKVEYVSGQTLTLENLELTLALSDGTTRVLLPEEYTVEPAEGTQLFAEVDTQITITYVHDETQTVTYNIPITVSNKAVLSLFISKMPDKLVYNEGEVFDPTGMIVRAYYNDNTTEEITNYNFTSDPFVIDSDSAQKVRVYITADDAEHSIEVTVNPIPISMITIATSPIKVSYRTGETFDPTGMVVKATYADGSVVTVPVENCIISPAGALTENDTMITVSFRGKTASLSISINGSTIITTAPVETTTEPDITTNSPNGESTDETGKQTNPSTSNDETTEEEKHSGMSGTLLVIFICLIVFIIALVVVLIIYYRRHFC